MVRFKNKFSSITCGLILFIGLIRPSLAQDIPKIIGTITQTHGTITFFPFKNHEKVLKVNKKSPLLSDGSYLIQDNSFLTAKLFDGSWLRVSPRSKLALDIDHKNKIVLIHLFTGSLKILISNKASQGKLEKISIKSGDTIISASNTKFSAIRNPIFENFSVYVEKGIVSMTKKIMGQSSTQLIHAMETVSVKDKASTIRTPRRISEKEIKFLQNALYLKKSLNKNAL